MHLLKKNTKKNSFTPSQTTLKFGSKNRPCIAGLRDIIDLNGKNIRPMRKILTKIYFYDIFLFQLPTEIAAQTVEYTVRLLR